MIRYGVHRQLEAEANRLIKESLAGLPRTAPERMEILTVWRESIRPTIREIHVKSGTPDPAIRLGTIHRSRNRARPDLNGRDGLAQFSRRRGGGSIAAFVQEYGTSIEERTGISESELEDS